jgi:replicative DNA helicase
MKNTISSYGKDFEYKLIAALIDDTPFMTQISDILKPIYFFGNASQWIIKSSLDYYLKYNKSPSFTVLSTEVVKLPETQSLLKQEIFEYLKRGEVLKNSPDLDYVKEQSIDFCRNQEIKRAIMECVELLNTSDYDGVKSTLDAALKSGFTRDIGHVYKDQFEDRYTDNFRNTVTTGWECIDDVLQGGLAGGELGVVVAPAGAGKSWVLSALGANALIMGKTVIHYTLELNRIYTARRYDSIITGFNNSNLLLHKDKIEDKVKTIKGNLIVEQFPAKTASILTLKSHLDRCIAQSQKPDVIIVDYADLLKGHNKELRFELKQIYEGLRALSAEYNCPIWTASQTNRSSLDSEIIEADKISEDYSKIAIGDFIMSLSRRAEDKVLGIGRFHIIKNRFGSDGITFPSKFDASNGSIDIFRENSGDAVRIRKEVTALDNVNRDKEREVFYNMFSEFKSS